ncbi:NUDIX hydrolase [Streptomyces sp. NPDC017260]|uniref:NUDIX hydrolase n=1 Tax=unclassified Streptomyces TaxID=2593676 RepID=UPI00379B1428
MANGRANDQVGGHANGQWYPREWPDRIRALTAGTLTPVTPKRAATVMLLKDTGSGTGDGTHGGAGAGGPGPAVHMLRRRASMAFAGGAYAYPGGGVDPRDDDRDIGWAGPARAWWADRLGVDEAGAQAIVCAAVRETYEEAGVLLAGPTGDSVVGDTTGADWEADRAALVERELSFAEFLDRRGLVLRSDLLGAWARWITPEFESRRYDTWFFVAALPKGQRTRNASTEADRAVWITPAEAAAGYDRGELLMMPPTIATLRGLAACGTAAEALASAPGRDMTPVLARARLVGGEIVLSWPGHDEFTRHVPTSTAQAPTTPSDPTGGAPA